MHDNIVNIKVIRTNLSPDELQHLTEVTNIILERLDSGDTTCDEIHRFLDWFFSLPKPNRQALLQDFEPNKNTILRCISEEKNLVLSPVNGTKAIADAHSLFAHIDDDFRLSKVEKGIPTPLTPISVYEFVRPATFKEALGSLNQEFHRLCFTQHQILNFVSRFRPWLVKGYPTFFPFKSHGKHFVVGVEMNRESELYATLYHLEFDTVWGSNYKARIVAPRFKAKE